MDVQREADLIKATGSPVTTDSMIADLKKLGLKAGDVVIVHSAMSKLGWVNGGAVAVILALESVLGENGTLVMPTHTGANSDPKNWRYPPVPESWIDPIRASMPAYDPAMSPTRKMGQIPETFRRQTGTIRSDHPQLSFAARGPLAEKITQDHHLAIEMGDGSPLDHIYQAGGKVLLLGVGFGNNTSIHLAEHRADFPAKKWLPMGCAMLVNGQREWVTYEGLDYDDEDFLKIGAAFMETYPDEVKTGKVGLADALLMPQPILVDFAVDWIEKNRKQAEK